MSRPTFVLTPEARQGLLEIWNYIAADSLDRADQVLGQFNKAFTQLGEMPGLGHRRESLADSRHRFWSVYSYVIAYRWKTPPIEIIAIVHGARQLDIFFQLRISETDA